MPSGEIHTYCEVFLFQLAHEFGKADDPWWNINNTLIILILFLPVIYMLQLQDIIMMKFEIK